MNMKLAIPLLVIAFILACYTHVFSNLWLILMGNGCYIIPQESNIFIFSPTKMNDGSGDWWLYGEDNEYYYSFESHGYYIKLQKGKEPKNFDKFNCETWNINHIHENL